MKRIIVAIAFVAFIGTGTFALSIGPHFANVRLDALMMEPCHGHGGVKASAMSLDADKALVALFTCADDQVMLATDLQHVTPDPAISLYLDWNNGGWAFECGHTIDRVQLLADGQMLDDIGAAFAAYQRPDVAAAYGNACPQQLQSGIYFTPNFAMLPRGTHALTMRVEDERGHFAISNAISVTQ